MAALPIRVTFLSPSGEVLGTKVLRPHGTNWRLLGTAPRVTVFPSTWDVPFKHRDCERYGEGWAVRLLEGDQVPLKIEAMEVESK